MKLKSCTKKELRLLAKNLRKEISPTRREQAHQAFTKAFFADDDHVNVLSYASVGDELDTTQLNQQLMEQGRLLLPKTEADGTMRLFHVTESEKQLKNGLYGIMEPDPEQCKEVAIEDVSLVIVPGLAFDRNKHRIGYGKGCYDRLLGRASLSIKSFGVGYKEQLLDVLIVNETNDVSLSEVYLF